MPAALAQLPAAPLLDLIDRAGIPARLSQGDTRRRMICRVRASGRISVRMADRLAVELLGVHPAAVWPEWFDLGRYAGR